MPIQPYQQAVIDLMIRHENAMRDLYLLYSAQHKGRYWDFWHQLVKEETSHANTVKLIEVSLEQGKADFREDRFKTDLIEKSLSYISGKIAEAQTGEVAILRALATALEIENSFIEHEYFSVIDEDSEDLRFILKLLQKGTNDHQERVKSAWEAENKSITT
ncbi:hypothetical protein HGA34_03600 [Candidatus Falkowbacteria bacterium]|nr:hypothetical protein [Candidatus Falkowbacteria bacterium]